MRKVALVTGAGRGIGLGMAKCLAAEGCDIIVCGIRSGEQVKGALDALRNLGANVLYCRADVADKEVRTRMLSEIKTRFARLNVLVNNAGVAPEVRADILQATEESWARTDPRTAEMATVPEKV